MTDCIKREMKKQGEKKGIDMLLSLVPFYDCVTGIIEKDSNKAVPSCVIDVVLLIPVVGEAMGFTAKFGLGVAKELIKRGIKGVLKNSKYFLPTRAESLKFGVSLVRYIDPGIEFVSDISKLLPKLMKLNFKGQSKEVKNLIATLEKLQKETSVASESIVKARLPQGGPEVPVKHVDEHLYVQVMNPQGDEFGEYFLLKNNQLEVFKGPVKFSEEQKKQINSVAVKIKDNQRFIDEKNVHPTAYGEGSIRTVLEAGKPNKLLIKMNNQWIPARETPIEGLGVRYDAEIERKLILVNFNGAEWYFEATTSPFLGKKVSNKIGKKLKRFETHSNPTIFSAPDERGLVRDTSGRSYIKIKNHYVPLILLDKGAERYHLVKKTQTAP